MLSTNLLRHGTEQPPTAPLSLRSGPFTLTFEPDTALLRHLRLGDHEAVRGIYGAVRDHNWATVPRTVSNLQVDQKENEFELSCQVECVQDEIDFVWQVQVKGDAQGTVEYRFQGEARSSFRRNRIGLCLLHPILECAGKPCTIEGVDGSETEGLFPAKVSPHQPFKNIRAIRFEPAPGQRVEVRLEGDTFEMEDQRNWTDASFKTYSTPLELPFPVQIENGFKVQHTVTVRVLEPRRKILPILLGRGAQISISTTPVLAKPALGLSLAPDAEALTETEINRLKRLRLSHLRFDIDLDTFDPATLERAAEEARQIQAGLQLALTLSGRAERELQVLTRELDRVKPNVNLWLVYHADEVVTEERWVSRVRQALQEFAPNALIAAGTKGWFAELNRNRPSAGSSAFPCYTLHPQCHAFDNTTLVENLAGQVHTVEAARAFSSRPVVISPITLRAQPNAMAGLASKELPTGVDPRQMSLFGAGWTLGSLSRLMSCGNVQSLTYYETTGWRGVMERTSGSPLPDRFPSIAGAVFPMFHVFADLAEFSRLYPTHSSHPLDVEAMTLLDGKNRRRILAANLMNQHQQVRIKTGSCRALVRYLDETNAHDAMTAPEEFQENPGTVVESGSGKIELNLLPYALARVDVLPS